VRPERGPQSTSIVMPAQAGIQYPLTYFFRELPRKLIPRHCRGCGANPAKPQAKSRHASSEL
jgi:hypothetical protein